MGSLSSLLFNHISNGGFYSPNIPGLGEAASKTATYESAKSIFQRSGKNGRGESLAIVSCWRGDGTSVWKRKGGRDDSKLSPQLIIGLFVVSGSQMTDII